MEMMRNPKNTKQEIKIAFFYLIDAGIVGLMAIIAGYMPKFVPVGGFGRIMFYVLFVTFGLFLCIKPHNSPTNRNIVVILDMLKQDDKKYHPIEVNTISSETAKK
ncbi:DUF5592 family protein [Bacillus cytotoxicus]|uniref:DUF5592 family protein n=1 Tax=Bacillus cereus group TaxID=86661 RepID=UPI000B97B28D|nr:MULTISPECIES: DUF5592 family protein [Bacillus cereus group]AWC30977.1 hypothetical protein CG483_022425 [Bacillus cytotoxicus]AWC35072.1 hypothetical protein CG482_022730 [Bacillus cytotoxicus]AWC39038.1 hypothetical protein CG481_022320 [Bacillus cytotoxicus]AWC43069.1 hypothetical protein CG480_022260 [Bacillus cytotoxicus]AWC47018.1 hypothetical protein CG479_021690 [Bacillus cytotoxicus]